MFRKLATVSFRRKVGIAGLTGLAASGMLRAGISVHGSTTGYQETGGDWLSMGTNDIDGSGGLGSDGWFFFGNFNNSQQNGQPFSFHVQNAPSYVSGFAQGANYTSAADEYASYGAIDNPNALNGTNLRGGLGLGTTGGAGSSNEVMTFGISGLEPGQVVRVGILAGMEGNPDGRWDPTSITLSEGGNSATVGNHHANPLPANPGGVNTGWAFFEIDSDGDYKVSVTKRLSGQGAGIAGLTFDSSGGGLDLTDPTDSEPDGMGDNWEFFYFGDLSRNGNLDFDGDGRSDAEEWLDETDPTEADIDHDGLSDGEEHALGTNPRDADSDADGWSDGEELVAGTDPTSDLSVPSIARARERYPFLPEDLRDAVVVFNEIHYHPQGDDSSLEYLELHNQMVVDVDLSNWRLAGDVGFDFPEGTVMPGGSYLVIAKDPSALQAATGYSGALGPFSGELSNSGGHLLLYNNNRAFRSLVGGGSPGEIREDNEGRRIMDEIDFSDTAPWPVGPDGSGSTLAKSDPATGTGNPYHWTASVPLNGTPGEVNAVALKPSLALNEISGTSDADFRIELFNYGSDSILLGGMIIASSDPAQTDFLLPAQSLAPGAFLTLNAATLGFTPADNNRVFLYGPGRLALIDAVRADDRARGRSPDGIGRWLRPDHATFGDRNSFAIEDAIVINEIFYHAYPQMDPFAERKEEWLELYNRSDSPVDLTAWKLAGGIEFEFPFETSIPAGGYLVVAKDAAALGAKYPGIAILGDYSGRLGDGGDLLVLEDPQGNPADEVAYHDSGKWHAAADGGGSSLELRDPDSDNAIAGAWAPSDESSRGSWQTYTYEGVAVNDGLGDNLWHELQMGLLDAGEFLLDDVSVIENESIKFLQNGDFESETPGTSPDKWRVIGTHGSHGRTVVVTDPDDPGNQCLRVVATGPTENKHNKLETTFANSERVVVGRSYRIQFRAKWISGSNQLNSRLYFNFLQKTTLLDLPEIWGTPGTVNSVAVANAGPSLSKLSHSPVVPNANEAVTVGIDASDLDGPAELTLFYSSNGGSLQSTTMTAHAEGRFTGTIPGQGSGTIVRFHVRGRDSLGAESFYPAAGAEGGAFYKVQDGYADSSGLRHNFRIVMSEADRSFLFLNTNRMSNDRFPATVIVNESTAYYDVALRLKASGHGRYQTSNYGFNIRFQPDQLFRGVHDSVSIERSGDYRDMLAKHLLNRAGGAYWSFYDDVAHIITPTANDRGVGLISMARHTSNFLDGLFPDAGEAGTLFNLELTYSPNGTTGGPEGLKIGNPYNHTNGQYEFADRGDDKEAYRWGFQIRSARDRDDYSKIVALNQAMELEGEELKAALDPLIDVDQWMRTYAMLTLNGTDDVYSRLWEHNIRYFVRPTDGKIIVMQWDLDRAFRLSNGTSVTPTVNRQGTPVVVAKLFEIPQYRRLFDGHIQDLIETTMNSTYAASWGSHLTTLTGDNLNGNVSYLTGRANAVQNSLPTAVTFRITTNGGVDFSVPDSLATLSGEAWIDVFSIEVNGFDTPVSWIDADTWEIQVPLPVGENPLAITALDYRGVEVGSDTITVENTGNTALASAANTVVSELHYHPADPGAAEMAAGFTDADDFEFVEITNVDASSEIDFTGVEFTDGVTFTFPVGTTLAAGERLVVVANREAFEFRYGAGSTNIAGVYTGQFGNGGEKVVLEAANATIIASFSYEDEAPWPGDADGGGYSLVYGGADPESATAWRSSVGLHGNPGSSDATPFGGGDLLAYALADDPEGELPGDEFLLKVRVKLGADDAILQARFSTDFITWATAAPDDLISRKNHGDGTATLIFRSPLSTGNKSKHFATLRLELK